MAKMKNNAIVGNIGHFDNEIEYELLKKWPGIVRTNIKPQVDKFTFETGKSVIILAEGKFWFNSRSFVEFGLCHWTSIIRDVNFIQQPNFGSIGALGELVNQQVQNRSVQASKNFGREGSKTSLGTFQR